MNVYVLNNMTLNQILIFEERGWKLEKCVGGAKFCALTVMKGEIEKQVLKQAQTQRLGD